MKNSHSEYTSHYPSIKELENPYDQHVNHVDAIGKKERPLHRRNLCETFFVSSHKWLFCPIFRLCFLFNAGSSPRANKTPITLKEKGVGEKYAKHRLLD